MRQLTTLPTRFGDITPHLIEGCLRAHGTIADGVRVASVEDGGVPGVGLVGTVHRLLIDYSAAPTLNPDDVVGPASLIVKLPSAGFEDSHELSAVEARFYLSGLPTLSGVRAPRLFGGDVDEGSGRSWLLLEDLGDSGIVRQSDGCTPEQAFSALSAAARLHARWWNRSADPRVAWVKTAGDSRVAQFCRRWIGSYTGPWPETLAPVMPRLDAGSERVAAVLESGPQTIAHGDFHSQNMYFRGGPEEEPALFDFQFVQQASGLLDVARFLVTSLQTDVRRAHESALLTHYQRSLASEAVEFDLDAHLAQLRAGLLWNLMTPVALHVRAILTTGNSWPARLPILERCVAAIDDWGAARLL